MEEYNHKTIFVLDHTQYFGNSDGLRVASNFTIGSNNSEFVRLQASLARARSNWISSITK